ncbi:unnamed protein product [Orchesella dallaii]|uniref:Uncharacterized protein n=1 Tax=Orchesella dallaii TaxID=48710 RepID=A0ABP1RLQ2_9HEXA
MGVPARRLEQEANIRASSQVPASAPTNGNTALFTMVFQTLTANRALMAELKANASTDFPNPTPQIDLEDDAYFQPPPRPHTPSCYYCDTSKKLICGRTFNRPARRHHPYILAPDRRYATYRHKTPNFQNSRPYPRHRPYEIPPRFLRLQSDLPVTNPAQPSNAHNPIHQQPQQSPPQFQHEPSSSFTCAPVPNYQPPSSRPKTTLMMNTVFLMQNPAPKIANTIRKPPRSSRRLTQIPKPHPYTPTADTHTKKCAQLSKHSSSVDVQQSYQPTAKQTHKTPDPPNSFNIHNADATGLQFLIRCLTTRHAPWTRQHITETAV